MFHLLRLVVLLLSLLCLCVDSLPSLCTVAQRWSINGRAFVDEYRGKVLFLVFMRLDCAECETTIKKCDSFMKYEALAEHFDNEIQIVVVAPEAESGARVRYIQNQYSGVRIVKESRQEPLWSWMQVRHNDGVIYDRCGRLAKHLVLPREGIETSHLVFDSLKAVVKEHPCGPCKYDQVFDSNRAAVHPTQPFLAPSITAYVSRNADNQQQRRGHQQQPQHHPQQQQSHQNNGYDSARNPQTARQRTTYPIHRDAAPRQTYSHRPQPQRQQQQLQSREAPPQYDEEFESVKVDLSRNTQSQPQKSAGSDTIYAQQQQPGVFNNDWQEIPGDSGAIFDKNKQIRPKNDVKPAKKVVKKDETAFPGTQPLTTPEPLYPDAADLAEDSDYYDYVADLTTPAPENVQIPKPTMPSKSWPTKVPSTDRKGIGQTCAGYNDEICYQQFLQFDDADIHRCCRKKVILTDQCVPGKCSNATQQLCCIQKFLQAKLACCLDEDQTLPSAATDMFSQCCYTNFVTQDDSCCSHSYALAQWKTVHELCLPHVNMDLSNIRVKTILPGTSVMTDFNFGQTHRWRFECKYGAHVPQYSYFENW